MKKGYSILTLVILFTTFFLPQQAKAQAPQKMSYQAVVRDASNALVTSSSVGMEISILQNSTSGTAVYVETHTPSTNANGLVSLEIGTGNVVSGDFSAIDWANGPYFIKTQTDPSGGTAYSITGTNQLLSVPFALYSASTGDTTKWKKDGTNIYSGTGNVGIGTNSPKRQLDVNGSGQFRIDANKSIIFDNAGTALRMYTDDYTGGTIGKDLIIGTYPNGHSNQLYLSTTGDVGIGTKLPKRQLDVNGDGQFRIDANKSIIFDNAGSALRMYTDDYTGGSIGKDLVIGTYPNGHTSQLYLSTTGNVGVGTNSPQRKLHVNDVLRLEPRSSAPSSPSKGDMYFDGTINKLRVYDGTTWNNCW